MANGFEKAKQALKKLHRLQLSQLNDLAVAHLLRCVSDELSTTVEKDFDKWNSETKLLDIHSIFMKIYYVSVNAKYDNDKNTDQEKDCTQQVLSEALLLLTNATFVSEKFCASFYENNFTLALLTILAHRFRENGWDGQHKKYLDYDDANTSMSAISSAMRREPRVGEQLRQSFCKDVLEQFFTCPRVDTALYAFSLCSYTTTNPRGNELMIPDNVLYYLLEKLFKALNGIDQERMTVIASSSLYRLQRLIVCSDEFNKKVTKCRYYNVFDLLSDILEASEPLNGADSQYYEHEEVPVDGKMVTTFLEKKRAASVCLALLLSERRYHKNAHKMLKHKRLLAALKGAARKPNDKLREVTKGVLWQLERKQPNDNTQSGKLTQPTESDAGQKLLSRPSAAPNTLAKSATTAQLPDSTPSKSRRNDRRDSAASQQTADHPVCANKQTVMISYSSKFKPKLVHRINKSLQQNNIDTWIYNEKLDGDIYNAMAEAIEECAVVLVCFSSAYFNSDPCHAEMNYARDLKKPVVLVRLEKFKPVGWLAISIAGRKYHDFASDELDNEGDGNSYDTQLKGLIKELSKMVNKPAT